MPAPTGDPDAPLKALIFDSIIDPYSGVIVYICIMEVQLKPGDKINMMATGKEFEVIETGVFTPKSTHRDELTVGDVGFLSASIKNVGDTRVGDTITMLKIQQLNHCLVSKDESNGVLWTISNRYIEI